MKTIEEARVILNATWRDELNDHAFGDSEVYWVDAAGMPIASGYFGGSNDYVGSHATIQNPRGPDGFRFDGAEARLLRACGKVRHLERNDSTGPLLYTEEACMPSLTLAAVFREIRGPR